MKTILINFATEHYAEAQKRLAATAAPWFDTIQLYRERDLPPQFIAKHAPLLAYARGHGFWVWKPYLIQRTLLEHPDSIVMWCDSQCMFLDDPAPLFKLCQNYGVLLFNQDREGHKNGKWTRRDAFIKMNCEREKYWQGSQLNTACSLWMNTRPAMTLLENWYDWCSDLQVVGDAVSVLDKELPEFKDHRHDQSILSLLAIKYKIPTFPDCTQFGNGYQEPQRGYPQILQIDRMVSAIYPIPCRKPS